jgi:hypothetical protein
LPGPNAGVSAHEQDESEFKAFGFALELGLTLHFVQVLWLSTAR